MSSNGMTTAGWHWDGQESWAMLLAQSAAFWIAALIAFNLSGIENPTLVSSILTSLITGLRLKLTLGNHSALVLGSGTAAQRLVLNSPQIHKDLGISIKGYLSIPGEPAIVDEDALIRMSGSLAQIVKESQCKIIVVAPDKKLPAELVQQLLDCKLNGIRIIGGNSNGLNNPSIH